MSYQQFRPASNNLLPVVTKNLIIINTILWLASTVMEEQFGYSLNEHFGLFYPLSSLFAPYQFVTHLFLHGGFTHLLLNMFALWMFGRILENYWGAKRFMIYYFVTGLGAASLQTLFSWYEIHQLSGIIQHYAEAPNSIDFIALMKKNVSYISSSEFLAEVNNFINNWEMHQGDPKMASESIVYAQRLVDFKMNIPTVGASGAVFGLLLAFGMLFPNQIIYLYFALPIKAKYFVALYGAFELWSGVSNNPGDNVAHFAHLGGMLFGVILIKYWNKTNRDNFY